MNRRWRLALCLIPLLAAAAVTTAWAATAPPKVGVWVGAKLTTLLNPAAAIGWGLEPGGQFAVLGDGRVIVLTRGGDFFDLDAGEPLPAQASLKVSAFTADGNLLITVRENRLGWYERGAIQESLQLPQKGLGIVAGPRQRLYLFGPRGQGSAIYLLGDSRAALVVDLPQGIISALAVSGERLIFAVGGEIYTVARGERPALLFLAAGQPRITSLAADPWSGMLYFATADCVYAMRAGVAVSILKGLGGTLRHAGGALYVLDSKRKTLVKLRGLEKLVGLTSKTASGGGPAPAPFKE